MKIGFTGTRDGMTEKQAVAFANLLQTYKPTHFAHGDCVGSDDQAADAVSQQVPGCWIICHPPVDSKLRAFNTRHHESREPKTHFARNRAIVDESDMVIATPREMDHQPRGGTWYTVDYAQKKLKLTAVVYPDGTLVIDDYLSRSKPWNQAGMSSQ